MARSMFDHTMSNYEAAAIVDDFMSSGPVTLHVSDNAGRARDLLAAMGFHALPVVEAGRIVGIVTTTDLADNWSDDTPVNQLMSRSPHSIKRDATLEAAASKMLSNEVHHLVIDDAEGSGILSSFDLLRVLTERTLSS